MHVRSSGPQNALQHIIKFAESDWKTLDSTLRHPRKTLARLSLQLSRHSTSQKDMPNWPLVGAKNACFLRIYEGQIWRFFYVVCAGKFPDLFHPISPSWILTSPPSDGDLAPAVIQSAQQEGASFGGYKLLLQDKTASQSVNSSVPKSIQKADCFLYLIQWDESKLSYPLSTIII